MLPPETTRREFQHQLLGSLLTFSLLETLFTRDAFADEVKPITGAWLAELNTLSRDLQGKPLEQVAWQKQVEALFAKVDLPEVLRLLDFEKLTANIPLRERGERSVRARLPKVEGLPTEWVFGHQVFCLGKGRSVVPHGHNNMATAFLILKGEFDGKHYDRLEDTAEHMIIQPTIDRAFVPGEYSTVSDYKDNVHWFKASSETAYIFNIHVLGLNAGNERRTGRVYIDPQGEKLAQGKIKARIIRPDEALKLYG